MWRKRNLPLLFALLFTGCELFQGEVITLRDQLKYQPVVRDSFQILVRLIPLFTADHPPQGFLYGEPPLPLPLRFPQGFSTVTDLSLLPLPPQAVTCTSDTLCTLEFLEDTPSLSLKIVAEVNPRDGNLLEAGGEVTTLSYGTFRWQLSSQGSSLVLVEGFSSPLTAWSVTCAEGLCQLSGALRQGIGIEGSLASGRHSFRLNFPTREPLFPWLRFPVQGAALWHPRGLTLTEEFTTGEEWQRSLFLDPLRLEEKEFLTRKTRWEPIGEGFLWEEDFGESGSLSLLSHRFFTNPFASEGTSEEIRYPRLLPPVRLQFLWKRTGNALIRLTLRSDPYSGVIHLFSEPLGVSFSGFLQSPFGDLLTFSGLWSHLGVMWGEFSGFTYTDEARPAEEGSSLVLPDGSMRTRMLFRQRDGSYAELLLFTPPEGLAAKAFE